LGTATKITKVRSRNVRGLKGVSCSGIQPGTQHAFNLNTCLIRGPRNRCRTVDGGSNALIGQTSSVQSRAFGLVQIPLKYALHRNTGFGRGPRNLCCVPTCLRNRLVRGPGFAQSVTRSFVQLHTANGNCLINTCLCAALNTPKSTLLSLQLLLRLRNGRIIAAQGTQDTCACGGCICRAARSGTANVAKTLLRRGLAKPQKIRNACGNRTRGGGPLQHLLLTGGKSAASLRPKPCHGVAACCPDGRQGLCSSANPCLKVPLTNARRRTCESNSPLLFRRQPCNLIVRQVEGRSHKRLRRLDRTQWELGNGVLLTADKAGGQIPRPCVRVSCVFRDGTSGVQGTAESAAAEKLHGI